MFFFCFVLSSSDTRFFEYLTQSVDWRQKLWWGTWFILGGKKRRKNNIALWEWKNKCLILFIKWKDILLYMPRPFCFICQSNLFAFTTTLRCKTAAVSCLSRPQKCLHVYRLTVVDSGGLFRLRPCGMGLQGEDLPLEVFNSATVYLKEMRMEGKEGGKGCYVCLNSVAARRGGGIKSVVITWISPF